MTRHTSCSSLQVGDEVIYEGFKPFRVMSDPPSDCRNSKDNLEDYYDGLGVHRASGIFNKAFYYLVEVS